MPSWKRVRERPSETLHCSGAGLGDADAQGFQRVVERAEHLQLHGAHRLSDRGVALVNTVSMWYGEPEHARKND